jgi:hypothetical protein
MQQEAALFVNANTIFSEGMISSFASNASTSAAAAAAAGDAGSSASNASSAGNSAGTIATIAAAIAVSVGALIFTPMISASPVSPPAIVAEYEVSFAGGASDREYVNPRLAVAYAREGDDKNLMKANSWMITADGENEALYSGDGGIVDEALSDMIESCENGVYIVSFVIEDENGNTWVLSREFALEASG